MDDEQANRPLARRGRRRQRCRAGTECAASRQVDVGSALRSLREARQLSIRALAEQSGLAVNTLSLIENGKTSPSVSTLQQLAETLDIPITAFFEQEAAVGQVFLTRTGQRAQATFDQGTLEDLGARSGDCPVEPFLVTLAPGASSGPGTIVHAGHEFVLCLKAHITYTVSQQDFVLAAGDSLMFAAHLPHRWQNDTDTEAQMLLMFCPSNDQHYSRQTHFDVQSDY